MNEMLGGMGIEIIGLKDIEGDIPLVTENGESPLENARIKAKAYYKAFKIPVFACDTGLYFEKVKKHEQPRVYVRRVNGKELNDEEMIEYYSNLAKKYGGELEAQYKNAVYFILNDDNEFNMHGEDIPTDKFIISSKVSKHRNEGFPLDSLAVEPKSRIHYVELDKNDKTDVLMAEGFRYFFKRSLRC